MNEINSKLMNEILCDDVKKYILSKLDLRLSFWTKGAILSKLFKYYNSNHSYDQVKCLTYYIEKNNDKFIIKYLNSKPEDCIDRYIKYGHEFNNFEEIFNHNTKLKNHEYFSKKMLRADRYLNNLHINHIILLEKLVNKNKLTKSDKKNFLLLPTDFQKALKLSIIFDFFQKIF